MTAITLPGLLVAILCTGAILCAVLPVGPRAVARLGLLTGVLAGALGVWLAAQAWLGAPVEATWLPGLPLGLPASLTVRIDALSGLFLLLLAIVPPVALLYAQGYLEGQPVGPVKRFHTLFLLLITGMITVVMAADWILFLFAWEIMGLAAYLLVMWDWRSAANTRAAWVYLLTTHVAGSGILLATCALSLAGGDFSFGGTTLALRELFARTPAFGHLLVGLFALGFAAKAALFPLAYWLPGAHGAAPAPVSAVLSGLMVKMGIYGLIRLFIFILPDYGQAMLVWGLILATLGTVNMVVGNIRSLGEQHAKRLVAQSSIGQIGYIVLGLGMAVALAGRAPVLAALAFAGALFHLVNHAFFKSLLFLTVGAVQHKTGTYDLRQMGGLIGAMPVAAAMTLLGALAIAGTPPLNGFASKWLLYRAAVFGGLDLPLLAVYGVIAIFISTVSLAAYLKYFGSVFLGAPRAEASLEGQGESRWMAAALWILGAACVLLGLFPGPIVDLALAALAGSPVAALYGTGQVSGDQLLGSVLGGAGYQPLAVLAALVVCGGLVALIRRLSSQPVRATRPWFGGEELTASEARYGSEHLYKPFLARYAALIRVWWDPHFYPPVALERAIDADRWLIRPVCRLYEACAGLVGRCHSGRIKGYVAWQLLAVAVLIVILITTEGGLR